MSPPRKRGVEGYTLDKEVEASTILRVNSLTVLNDKLTIDFSFLAFWLQLIIHKLSFLGRKQP